MPELHLSANEVLGNIVRLGPFYLAVFFVACGLYVLQKKLYQGTKSIPEYYIWMAICFALAIRIFLAYYEYGNIDVTNFMRKAERFYSEGLINFYKYFYLPPFYIWVLLLCKYVSIATTIPLYFLIKLPAILTDTFFTVFVLSLSVKTTRERQNLCLLLACSPIFITTSTVLVQFDIIPTLLSFIAFVLLLKDNKRWKLAALCLAFGILIKTFPVILLPAFLANFPTRRKQLSFLCVALAPVVLSLIAVVCFSHGVPKALLFRGIVGGSWGFSGMFWLLGIFSQHIINSHICYISVDYLWNLYNTHGLIMFFIFLGTSYFFVFRKISLVERIVITYLGFYIFSNAVAPQYIVWILPFLFFSNLSFAAGFHFWAIIWFATYVPIGAQGPLHIDKMQYLYPLAGGFLWAYCVYCLCSFLVKRDIMWSGFRKDGCKFPSSGKKKKID